MYRYITHKTEAYLQEATMYRECLIRCIHMSLHVRGIFSPQHLQLLLYTKKTEKENRQTRDFHHARLRLSRGLSRLAAQKKNRNNRSENVYVDDHESADRRFIMSG